MGLRRVVTVVAVLVIVTSAVPVRAQTAPLALALVLPVTSAPLFTPDGNPAEDARPRLNGIASVLRDLQTPELDAVPFALAPSPLFCDEVQRFGGRPGAAVRSALRALAARLPVLAAPYAEVRLPDLDSERAVAREIDEGRERVEPCTGAQPAGALVPPGLTVDRVVLDAAPRAGVTSLLAAVTRREPVRSGSVTIVPAARIEAGDAPDDAYARFASSRSAAAILPFGRPDLVTFMNALASDPRITLRSLSDIVGEAEPGSISFASGDNPPESYELALRNAALSLERLGWYTLPRNPVGGVLRTSLARARSSAEWDGNWSIGRVRARALIERVNTELRLISASEGSVTFTSQRGSVPVTVRNSAAYPVRIRIALESAKLRFPEGSSRVAIVEPPGETVVFEALARSTGTFPVQVMVTSPNRAIRFDADKVTVRSTAANVPALALTAGGALFLIAWYARLLRRRRHDRATES
ncbi:MAG TPA: DUF6049 family protein [Actinomycetota bacterium]|jgi:hypothetical protein|nr:DUF6049 family protein [Actinomycetota bacterium]